MPDQLTHALSTLSLLPQAVVNQGAKQVGVPQLPQVPLPPLAAVGLSLQTLTAQGHTQVLALDKWFLGIAFLCALLLAVLSARWKRLSNPAWALVSGAVPGAFGIGVVAFFEARYPTPFRPYAGLLHLLAGAFMPVYLGALAVGVLALVLAGVGDVVLGMFASRQPAEARVRARQSPAPGFYEQPVGVYRRPAPQQPASYTPSYSDRGSGARSPYPSAADPTQAYAARDYGGTAPPPRASTAWQQSGQESRWPPATEGGQRQASPSGPQWSRGPNSAPRPPTTWQLDPGAAPWSPPGAMTQRPPATSGPLQSPDSDGPLWPPAPAWGDLSQPQAWQPAGQPARQPGSSRPNWPPAPSYGQSVPSGQPWPPRPNTEPRPPQADDEPWASQADDDPWAPRRP